MLRALEIPAARGLEVTASEYQERRTQVAECKRQRSGNTQATTVVTAGWGGAEANRALRVCAPRVGSGAQACEFIFFKLHICYALHVLTCFVTSREGGRGEGTAREPWALLGASGRSSPQPGSRCCSEEAPHPLTDTRESRALRLSLWLGGRTANTGIFLLKNKFH